MHLTRSVFPQPVREKDNPLAILSGENIYVVYPNGKVEAIAVQLAHHSPIEKLLQRCQFWGDLAIG
jgi:hypothetical protein